MNYCLIENGQITEGPRNLPKTWRNISGFHLNSDADLLALGWYPVEYVTIPYNNTSHYVAGHNLGVQSDKVTLTDRIAAYTRFQLGSNTMNDWSSAVLRSDEDMSRKEEDHIDLYHGGVASTASKGPKKKTDKQAYDAKKALRSAKPADPVPPQPGEPDYKEPPV